VALVEQVEPHHSAPTSWQMAVALALEVLLLARLVSQSWPLLALAEQ
jgi:hypothetical protein